MAKLYFYYSAMNAGKSTVLLQSSHNYNERGMQTLLFTPALDTRAGQGIIRSRIGLAQEAWCFDKQDNLLEITASQLKHGQEYACILIDEAQFLSKEQVNQLAAICDQLKIPVLAYGLRTDFRAELFPGSAALLALADELIEIKTVCFCGKKASMNMRVDNKGQAIREGEQVQIGGNESYVSVCRRHFNEGASGFNVLNKKLFNKDTHST